MFVNYFRNEKLWYNAHMDRTLETPAIAIIRGGTTPDAREASLASGSSVYHTLRDTYDVSDIHLTPAGSFELDGQPIDIENFLQNFDGIVFHTLKGKEAGYIQELCRQYQKASTGNYHTRYGEAGKLERRDILRKTGVKTIPYWRLAANYDAADVTLYEAILKDLRYPVVISPLPDAFSVDAVVVRSEGELLEVLDRCMSLESPVTVSDSYKGNLYATVVMQSFREQSPYVFPAYELLHNHDVANAYDQDDSTHRPLSSGPTPDDVIALSKSVFSALHLRDIARVDILETPDNELYVLDVDPHPALDRHSLVADAAGRVGGTISEVLATVTRHTHKRHKESTKHKKIRNRSGNLI
ncbi:MAG: hypothetical protein WD335_02260 [Candidatus Paceibacterota bacterium]